MLSKDKVIVIIPSFNGRKYWDDLLPNLGRENYQDFELEILIVDNNSTDDSVEFIKNNFPQIKLIVNPQNTGYVGANNLGYQYAKKVGANYIYLLNQDTVITPGWLQPLYNFAKDKNKFGSLQSKIRLWSPDNQPIINSLGNAIHYLGFGYAIGCEQPDNNDQAITKISYASGAGVFISMSALADLGGLFDETMFMYLEDLDLGWSLQLLGYNNYLIPDSIIYHKYEFDRTFKQVYWFERNRLWLTLKNYKILTLLVLFPVWLLMELGQFFFAWKHGYFKQKVKAYSWILSNDSWQTLLAKRKFIQTHRKINDRTVSREFTGQILFQPLASTVLKIANFFFDAYWQVIKLIIVW